MADQASPSIVPRPHTAQSNYEGDCLDRKKIGDRLTRLVARLEDGGVIGVDGKWGEGKTWLATHWLGSLGIDRTTVKVDAFECDFQDDPFASISQALYEAINVKGKNEAVKGKVVSGLVATAKAIGVGTAKLGINFLTGGASDPLLKGAADLAERALDAAGQAGEEAIKEWLTAAERRRSALQCLKAAIVEYVASQGKPEPLVIVIDELDRCRPSYALRMLDVLKHLFDMPGLVFVLFVNREQLEATVATQFGRSVGNGYLDKFVHLWLPLTATDDPKRNRAANGHLNFLKSSLQRIGTVSIDGELLGRLAWMAVAFELQARDVERLATLLASIERLDVIEEDDMTPWLIALKIARPSVYRGVLLDEAAAHEQAVGIAADAALRIALAPYSAEVSSIQVIHRELAKPGRDWREKSSTANNVGVFGTKAEAVAAIGRIVRWIEA